MKENKIRSGFVGLIGRTNVGKSTLINKILKKKVLLHQIRCRLPGSALTVS